MFTHYFVISVLHFFVSIHISILYFLLPKRFPFNVYFILKRFYLCIYFRVGQSTHAHKWGRGGRGRGRGKDRILSRLHPSEEPDGKLDLLTLRSSQHQLKPRVSRLPTKPPRCPLLIFLIVLGGVLISAFACPKKIFISTLFFEFVIFAECRILGLFLLLLLLLFIFLFLVF